MDDTIVGNASTRGPSLYHRIGPDFIAAAITEFYRRAFDDGIIGHFFFGRDRTEITAKQITFANAMLGGPRLYTGRPLEAVHAPLPIGMPHFGRRQVLMAQVLDDMQLAPELRDAWLALEEKLRPLVV